MATPEDAAAGYRLYVDSDASVSLGDINSWLESAGYSRVSQRMYQHYQKLWRLGYRQYLTINRLDTRTVKDPVWDPSPRGITEPTDEPLELRFDDGGTQLRVGGRAVEIGGAGFVAHIDNDAMASVFERARSISPRLEVRFSHRDAGWIPAELSSITSSQRKRYTAIRCIFERFGAYEEIHSVTARNSSIEVSCGSADTALTVAEAAQLSFWLHETLEATRKVAELLNNTDLPVAQLRRLRFGSQWVAVIDLAIQHKEVILTVLGSRVLLGVPDKLKTLEDYMAARSRRREENSPEFVEHRRRMRAAELRAAEAHAEAAENAVDRSATLIDDVSEADRIALLFFGIRYSALGPEEQRLVRVALAQAFEGQDRLTSLAAPLELADAAGPSGNNIVSPGYEAVGDPKLKDEPDV